MEIRSLEPGDEETLEDIYRLLNRAYRNCRPWCHVTCQGLVLVVRQLASRFRVLIGTQWYIDLRQDSAHVLADNSWRGSITHSYTYEYNNHFLFFYLEVLLLLCTMDTTILSQLHSTRQVQVRNYHTIHRPQYRPFQTPAIDPLMHHLWMDRRMGSDPVSGHWTAELESGDTQASV